MVNHHRLYQLPKQDLRLHQNLIFSLIHQLVVNLMVMLLNQHLNLLEEKKTSLPLHQLVVNLMVMLLLPLLPQVQALKLPHLKLEQNLIFSLIHQLVVNLMVMLLLPLLPQAQVLKLPHLRLYQNQYQHHQYQQQLLNQYPNQHQYQ